MFERLAKYWYRPAVDSKAETGIFCVPLECDLDRVSTLAVRAEPLGLRDQFSRRLAAHPLATAR